MKLTRFARTARIAVTVLLLPMVYYVSPLSPSSSPIPCGILLAVALMSLYEAIRGTANLF